jgi:hypothetical protein
LKGFTSAGAASKATVSSLKALYGGQRDAGRFRELILRPTDQRASGLNLPN